MRTKFSGILTLFMAFVVQLTFAQEKTITGMVSDVKSGMPLAGVNIVIEGTTTGTQTDFDGNYSISASNGQTLVFTYIGYADKKVPVGTNATINVTLSASASELDQVVVTAFGIERQKKELTYSTEVITAEELTQAAPINAVTALQGKASGLNILTKNNGVNPKTAIILRGYSSLTGGNEALIVIDGIIQASIALNALNPSDILTSNVLKGTSATALYGSQGANGAIIITTKKGTLGTGLEVNVNSSVTFESVKYFPETQTKFGSGLDLNTYIPYENTQWGPRFDGQIRRIGRVLPDGSFQEVPYAPIKDNRKDFFQTGVSYINGFSMSGGDDKSTFYFSARRTDVTGIVPKDEYRRDNFRLNASRTEGKLKISTNVSFYKDKEDVHGASGGYQGRELYWHILNTPVNIPLTRYKNWRTDKFSTPEGYFNEYYQNPYMLIDVARDLTESSRLFTNVKFDYEFNDWIKASYSLSGTFYNERQKNTEAAITYNPLIAPTRTGSNTAASVFERMDSNQRINSDLLITFDRDFAEDFNATLILGNSVRNYSRNLVQVIGNNLVVPGLYNTSIRTGELQGQNFETEFAKTALFADLTLGYKDYLFVNGAYRSDVSSTLPINNNRFEFYTAGVSFVATDAIPSIKGDVLKFLKFSGSIAKVGNDAPIGFINETFSAPTGFPFGSTPGFRTPTVGADPNFSPEITNSYEFGVQTGWVDNRITLNATYFNNTTDKQFTQIASSYASGIRGFKTNSGEVENKGFEIDLGITPIRTKDITWDVNLNLTKIDNEVLSISQGTDRTQVGLANSTIGIFAQVGESFPQLYGTGYTRDDQGRVVISPDTGNPLVSSDLVNLGNTTPDLIIGGSTSFRYKDLTLSAVADYKTGHVYFNQMADALEFSGSTVHSASSNRMPFVFPNSSYQNGAGDYVANTNILTSDGGFSFWNSTYNAIKENYVSDATTLKLREVALSYNLPERFLNKTFIKEVSFGIVARNLIMLRSAQNVYTDPEFTNDSQSVAGLGTIAQLPPTSSYGFKVNLKF